MTEPLSRDEWAIERAAYDIAKGAGFPCKDCGQHWGGQACHCPTCHLTFLSEFWFDNHRVGDFEPTNTRRCLTQEELESLGWEPWIPNRYWRRPEA